MIDDACTLCGACAQACPTGALDLTGGQLTTRAIDCIRCGTCTAACPESAVEVATATTSDLLVRRELVVDEVVPCASCGEPHLPARLLDRARDVVARVVDRPPTPAARSIAVRRVAPSLPTGCAASRTGVPSPWASPRSIAAPS
ncbi:MAG: 4Fe-4S binding protein [Acidimicrobiia bacterium]|nr:4Fe-4S binding protein [Acidimicrobiia bacterium]